MPKAIAQDRDALYYPYFHIRDLNWLKAALLCFPHVHRMIPHPVVPMDPPPLREFCTVRGPRDQPLLLPTEVLSEPVRQAERMLLAKLKPHSGLLAHKYSRGATIRQYGPAYDEDPFQVHTQKIDSDLATFLITQNLAWRSPSVQARPSLVYDRIALDDSKYWVTLHPWLGAAIMSTIATAIATEFGLDIVTDCTEVHHRVISCDDIIERLLAEVAPAPLPRSVDDSVDDIAEVVITATFDVSRFSAQDIANLQRDGKDLRRFKDALLPIAQSVPVMADVAKRDERLREAAAQAISEWEKYRRSLPRFALDALTDATDVRLPDIASSVLSSSATAVELGLGAGIAVFLLTHAGFRIWRKYRESVASPYQYLNRIGKTHLSLFMPVHSRRRDEVPHRGFARRFYEIFSRRREG